MLKPLLLGATFGAFALATLTAPAQAGSTSFALQLAPLAPQAASLALSKLTREEVEGLDQEIEGSMILFDEPLGYRMEIPPGFQQIEEPAEGMMYAFALPLEDEDEVMVISIAHMDVEVPKDRDPKALLNFVTESAGEGAEVRPYDVTWDGTKLDGVEQTVEIDGMVIKTYIVVIPIAEEAIQLVVSAPESYTKAARTLLNQMMTTLYGTTNW